MAFPTSGSLDTFNRANTGPPPSANWTTDQYGFGLPGLKVVSNACACNGGFAAGWWSASSFAADQEAWVTVSTWVDEVEVHIRLQNPGTAGVDGYILNVISGSNLWRIYRMTDQNTTLLASGAITMSSGDQIGISAVGTTLTAYQNHAGGGWTTLGSTTDATYNTSGYIGLFASSASTVFDNFGGGAVVAAQTGASTASFTFGSSTSGVRTRLGAATNALTLASTTSAVRDAHAATSAAFTLASATSGVRTTAAASSLPLTFASATTGVLTRVGASALPVSFAVATSGVRETFAATSLPLQLSSSTSGVLSHVAATSFPVTFGSTTSAGSSVTGAATAGLTFASTTTAVRTTFGSTAADVTFASTTTPGTDVTGSTHTPIQFGALTVGFYGGRGRGANASPASQGAPRERGLVGVAVEV
jgi:hypothetical protein